MSKSLRFGSAISAIALASVIAGCATPAGRSASFFGGKDPKGDIGNLLLAFPDLAPADFAPWVDPAEANRKGVTPDQLAAQTAELWRSGLAKSHQPVERIAK